MSWEWEQDFTSTVESASEYEAIFVNGDIWVFNEGKTTDPNWKNTWLNQNDEPMDVLRGLSLTIYNYWNSMNGNTSNKDFPYYNDQTQSYTAHPSHLTTDYERLTYHFYFDNNTHEIYKNRIDLICCNADSITDDDKSPYTNYGGNLSATKWHDRVYLLNGQDILEFDVTKKQLVSSLAQLWGRKTVVPAGVVTDSEENCVFVPGTGSIETIIQKTTETTPNSNLCAANGKLYVTTLEYHPETYQQWLYIYNIATDEWKTVALPGRHQGAKRHIVDGLDGFVWITAKNSHSIIKVNVNTDEVVATIRINRHPYKMTVNQGKQLFVASDPQDKTSRLLYHPDLATLVGSGSLEGASGYIVVSGGFKVIDTKDTTSGMITLVDQSANTQSAYASGKCDGKGDFFDDGNGYLWFVTDNHYGRLNKSTKEIKTTFKASEGAVKAEVLADAIPMIPDNSSIIDNIQHGVMDGIKIGDAGSEPTILKALVTPQFTYQRWNGFTFVDITVKPYLFLILDGEVRMFRLSAFVRKNKYIHRGTAMIAIGDQAFYGDE